MRILTLGMLCGLAFGCNTNNPPTTGNTSRLDQKEVVQANRPITQDQTTANAETVDPTNTGINVRDRESSAKTPLDQYQNQPDIKLTADIRARILKAEMSVNADNVKIISQDGKVTLRGPVKSDEEKQEIETIALEIAGSDKVDSQLEVIKE